MPFYDYSISVPPGRKLRMRLGRYGGLNEAFVMFLILQDNMKKNWNLNLFILLLAGTTNGFRS